MSTTEGSADAGDAEGDALGPFPQFLSLRRDVLVLSVATFAFGLAFRTTGRYVAGRTRLGG